MLLRRLWVRLYLITTLALCCVSCDEPVSAPDDSFGLPGKGDESCDPSAVLCWSDGDASAARALMQVEGEVALGDRSPEALYNAISLLSHKLNPAELEALKVLKATPLAEGEEGRARLLKQSFEQVYGRALSGYWGAHATLLASALNPEEGEAGEKADGVSSGIPSALPVPAHLRPAFEELWEQGPFGQYMVTMISLTGTGEHRSAVRAFQDRDLGEDAPVDLEAQWISERFARYAALESTLSNLSSLIPVVGVWVSVPYGLYGQFKQRMKMTLELMTLYGFDTQDPSDFLLSVQLLTAAQGYQELFSSLMRSLVGAQTYRIFVERSPELLSDEFSERRIREVKAVSFAQFGVIGARLMAGVLAKAGQGTTRALLGQITFGISALVDVSVDYINTLMISRELRYALHPWGVALPYEEASWMSSPEHRSCAYALLTEVARANGDVTASEASLMLESLMRPVYVRDDLHEGMTRVTSDYTNLDGVWGIYADAELLLSHLSESIEVSPYQCGDEHFRGEGEQVRLSLLASLEMMAWADQELDVDEERFLSFVGEALEFKQEEARVYDAMRERVATTRPFVMSWSDELPYWREPLASKLEALDRDALEREVWGVMR